MKWLLLFFVSLGIIYYANGANMDETNLNELIKNIPDKWDLLEVKSKDSDEVWFFRKNIGAKTIKANKSLQTLIYFTIKYKPKDNSGLPNEHDTNVLFDFEENIIPKIEKNAICIHVASVMKSGVKDHLYYVSNPDVFLKTISSYQDHLKEFSISIEKQDDPEWKIYDDFPERAN